MTEDSTNPPDFSAISQRPAGPAAQDEAAPSPAIDVDIFCPTCGYNLRGLTGNRCPECGGDIEAYRQRGSLLPWVYRDRIGRFRAFWKTVWLVTFDDRRLATEVGRPVGERHARRFHWVVIAHAYLAVLAVTGFAFAADTLPGSTRTVVGAALMQFPALLMLAAIATLPSWGFRSRSMPLEAQRQAAVLLSYASAPLAWLVVAGIMALLGFFSTATGVEELPIYEFGAACLVAGLSVIAVLYRAHRLARQALGRSAAAWRFTLKLMLSYIVVGLMLFVALPYGLFLLSLAYYSLK